MSISTMSISTTLPQDRAEVAGELSAVRVLLDRLGSEWQYKIYQLRQHVASALHTKVPPELQQSPNVKEGAKADAQDAADKKWWHKSDKTCPISLEPIRELPEPPFQLASDNSSVVHLFDSRLLAEYFLKSDNFIDPINRRPLTLVDCVKLEAHLEKYYPEEENSAGWLLAWNFMVKAARQAEASREPGGGAVGSLRYYDFSTSSWRVFLPESSPRESSVEQAHLQEFMDLEAHQEPMRQLMHEASQFIGQMMALLQRRKKLQSWLRSQASSQIPLGLDPLLGAIAGFREAGEDVVSYILSRVFGNRVEDVD